MRPLLMLPLLAALLPLSGRFAAAADNPRDLQAEMVKVESEYFALYNQLNTEHQYDMVCQKTRPTGSRFDTRVCQPRYLLTAKEDAASQRMQSAVSGGQSAGSANNSGADVGHAVAGTAPVVQLSKEQAFRTNMLSVLNSSPELQALGDKRDALQARYEAATKGAGSR
ncbi:MAG: hypothetical protein ABI616_10585 [Pseudomonadota bacterium]